MKAEVMAARVNDLAGFYAEPTPVTQVAEWIRHIPRALEAVVMRHGKIPKQERS
jgi:hypothetical protein